MKSPMDTHAPARWRSWFALIGAPIAWAGHGLCGYYLASVNCPMQSNIAVSRHVAYDWPFVAMTILSIVIASTSCWQSWVLWTTYSKKTATPRHGRERFLSSCAVLSSGLFTLAVFFNMAALWVAPLCG